MRNAPIFPHALYDIQGQKFREESEILFSQQFLPVKLTESNWILIDNLSNILSECRKILKDTTGPVLCKY